MSLPTIEIMKRAFPDISYGGIIEQVSISVVNRVCQLNCIYCPIHNIHRPGGFIDKRLFVFVLDQVRPNIINLQGYGEPTLHPEFGDILTIAKAEKRWVKFFSNLNGWTENLARSVVEAGVDQIIVSVDAFDEKTYTLIRRKGSIIELQKCIRFLVSEKQKAGVSHPEIIFNIVIFRDTINQIERAVEFAKEIGEGQPVYELMNDYGLHHLKTMAKTDTAIVRESLMSVRTQAIKLEWTRTSQNINFNLAILEGKNSNIFSCYRPWRLLTVLENGDIVPCGEYHDSQIVFGNINFDSVQEVWNSPVARTFRNKLLSDRRKLPVCARCTVNEEATDDLFLP